VLAEGGVLDVEPAASLAALKLMGGGGTLVGLRKQRDPAELPQGALEAAL
jgi:hypothetical protein